MTTRQANLDANDISDETVADNFRCFVKGGKRALPGAGLPDDAVPLNSFDDCLLLRDGTGEGFLAVDILLPGCSFCGDQCVPVIRHCDHYCINIIACQQFAIVLTGPAILGAVAIVDSVNGAL